MGNYYGEYERYYRTLTNKNNRYYNSNKKYGRGNRNVKSRGKSKDSFFSLDHIVKTVIKQLVIVFILLISFISIKFINTPETKLVNTYITNTLKYNQDFNEYVDKAVTLKLSDIVTYATEAYQYVNDKLETLKSQ